MSQYDIFMLWFLAGALGFLLASPFLALIEPTAGALSLIACGVLFFCAGVARDCGREAKRHPTGETE